MSSRKPPMTVNELRNRYPTFHFSSCKHELSDLGLEVTFTYSLEDEHTFHHKVIFHAVTQDLLQQISSDELDTYLLTIGLSEMLNYWKLTASPKVHISAVSLSATQLAWWKDLLIQGLGEYFYVNQIKFTDPDFVTFTCQTPATQDIPLKKAIIPTFSTPKVLIPVGGGKDSAVTLSLIGATVPDSAGFMVNAIPSAVETLAVSPIKTKVTVTRILDPHMLELNSQGFLNGHVPISSVLASMSVFAGRVFGYTHVTISNERSSNEGNIFYCDRDINHRYSKTFAFEESFTSYCQTYLPQETPHYFSFLRPIYELQIAKIFAQFPEYHALFRSCNRGQKNNSWCGECSKCLFAYSIMVPFLGKEKTAEYFGKDMFQDTTLYYLAEELLGVGEKKPFECVGTHEETICAFYLATKQYQGETLPPLLALVQEKILRSETELEARTQAIFDGWNLQHLIPAQFETLLKEHTHVE